MKVKLLKKLRRRFQLQERNGEYRYIDTHNVIYDGCWSKKKIVLEARRNIMLFYARKDYKDFKRIID